MKSVAAYWAMLAEVVPAERLERFVAHLDNEKEFKHPNRVPTMPADSPYYVKQYGYDALAHDIALACVDHATKVYNETGTLWENYAPEFPAPGVQDGNRVCGKDFVGWSGLIPIVIQADCPVEAEIIWEGGRKDIRVNM